MIQNYFQLKQSVDIYNEYFCNQQEAKFQIQKIYSTAELLCLVIRFPGKTKYLYLGRGAKFQGFWMGESIPPPKLRIRDRFLEYLRKHLRGGKIGKIILDMDRIVAFQGQGHGKKHIFGLFWKGPMLYFLHVKEKNENYCQVFLSWEGRREEIQSSFNHLEYNFLFTKYFGPLGRMNLTSKENKSTKEGSASFFDFNDYFEKKLNENRVDNKLYKRKLKYHERKLVKIRNDLENVKKWQEVKEVIEKYDFIFPEGDHIDICGIKFKINKDWNKYKKIDAIYDKIKKLKKAHKILVERLQKTQNDYDSFLNKKNDIAHKLDKVVGPKWASDQRGPKENGKRKKIEKDRDVKEIRIYKTTKGDLLAIGLSSIANDYLRNRWAQKDDLWFHIDQRKGAHCILRSKRNDIFQGEIVDLIGSLLRDQNKQNIMEIPLIYCKVKDVKGLKGKAGAVILKKTRHFRAQYIANWEEKLERVERE